MSTITATDTITIRYADTVEYEGRVYFKLEAGHPAAEDGAIVVRNIETGEITIRAWRDDYINWWWASPQRRTHELLARHRLGTHSEGVYLYRPEALIEGVRGLLADGDDAATESQLEWVLESALDVEASVEYEVEYGLDDA